MMHKARLLAYFFSIILQSIITIESAIVTIYKCPESRVTNIVKILIPHSLRMPYPPQILQHLEQDELFNFHLAPFPPNRSWCSHEERKSTELEIQNNYSGGIKKDKLNSTLHLYSGTLYYFNRVGILKAGKVFYQPLHYCISRIMKTSITIETCPHSGLLPKCCPLGMIMKLNLNVRGSKVGCALVVDDWNPPVFPTLSALHIGASNTEVQPDFEYYQKILGQCPNIKTVHVSPGEEVNIIPAQKQIRILNSGEVYTRVSGNHRWEQMKLDFCLDGLLNTANSPDALSLEKRHTHQIILACEPGEGSSSKVYSIIYFVGYMLSGFVSLLTFIAYLMIWDQQNVHGWTVAMLAISLCLNSVFIGAGHGYGLWTTELEPTPVCIGVGILAHFFYVASFAWMTVLNFDLFTTLKSMVPTSRRPKGKKLFGAYSLFAFGIPALVVTISIILETQFSLFDDRVIRPQYGRVLCHLDNSAELYHAVIINAILIGTNVIMGLLTIIYLMQAQKSIPGNANSNRRSQSRGGLLCRLLVVMGLSWIFDVISWLISGAEVKWYWVILDLYNCAQSLILFWIFIINGTIVRKQLSDRYKFIRVGLAWLNRRADTDLRPISSEIKQHVSREPSSSSNVH